MSIKSKLLQHLSQADFEPYYWWELSEKEQINVKVNSLLYITAPLLLAAFVVVAKREIDNTPVGCFPVLFPEQTFIQQPEHCQSRERSRITPAPLL